jgi:dCTP deaminase
MVLSDQTIKQLIKENKLVVQGIDDMSIQPASIDCRLGDNFLIMDENFKATITLETEINYLATTQEYIELPDDLTAFVEGRSSIGRMGLFIQNAGWVDPGFKGRITLELYNASSLPIKLEAGKRICQLVFCKMDAKAQKPYQGKYQGQNKTVGSRVFMDTDRLHLGLKEDTQTINVNKI